MEDGKLAWAGTTAENDLTLTTGTLPEGTYTVVMMEYSPLVTDPDSLDALKKSAMKQGRDYVQTEISVTAGTVSEFICMFVPVLHVENFSYTDPKASSYITNKTTVSAGKFFTLRANAQIARSYQGRIRNMKWVFVLPEGTEYYEGTLTVDGKAVEEYEYSDNTQVFPVEDPNQLVRFCANAVGQGEGTSTAYLEFDLDGKTLRQSIGAVNVKIGDLEMELSGKTFTPEITVLGTAAGGADIMLYDGDVLIGQAKAAANGNWKIQGTLYNPGSYSVHDICAVMLLPTGTQVRSAVKQVVYQYSAEPVTVSKVTMFLGSSKNPAVAFDFLDPNAKLMSYSVVGGETFTYLVEFDCPDYEKLSDVKLEVSLTDGSTQTLDTVFDQDRQAFVTSSYYNFNALPVNVAVSYCYDAMPQISPAHMAEIKETAVMVEETQKELSELLNGRDTIELSPLTTDYGSACEVSEDFKQAVDKYNIMVEEYHTHIEELKTATAELFEDIQVSEDGISSKSDLFESSLKEVSLSRFTIADKITEGYEVYQVGDSAEDLVLVRFVTDTETDAVSISLIDTSSTGEGLALMAANAYAGTNVTNNENVRDMVMFDGVLIDAKYVPNYKDPSYRNSAIGKDMQDWIALSKQTKGITDFFSEFDKTITRPMEIHQAKIRDQIKSLEQALSAKPNAELSAQLAKEKKALEKITKDIADRNLNTRSLDIIGGLAGVIVDGAELATDSGRYSELDKLAKQTYDPNVIEARRMLLGKMIVTGLSFVGSVAAIVGLAGATVGGVILTAPVSIGLMLVGGIILPWWMSRKVDEKIVEAKQKYSGGNASGSGQPAQPKIDPSGYIYEAVASNRLPGVTVTCYEKVTGYDMYDEPHTEITVWDAEEYEQTNPLVTDAEGRYEWDVPQGWWQVKAELDGYETTYSDWLPVPPPQLEVNLAMVSYAVPQVESVTAAPKFVDVTFSKYMRAELLVRKNITFYQGDTRITGKLELLDSEVNPLNSEEFFARKVRFIPNSKLEAGSEITISLSEELCSYADVSVGSNVKLTATVTAQPESLKNDETVTVEYLDEGTVTVWANPAELCAGMTVSVTASSLVQLSKTTVVLDENGRGQLTVTGKLPGEAELVFTLEGTKLESRTLISIPMPEAPSCDHNELTVQTHIYWETFADNGDGQTHCRNALEMNRLYCADCKTYPEMYYQGKYYPNSGEVKKDLPHRFQEGTCQDCGAVESKGIPGDADGDSFVTPIDAMLVLQFYVGDITYAMLNAAAADVDGDGFTTPIDAMLILQYYVGDIVNFPVEG